MMLIKQKAANTAMTPYNHLAVYDLFRKINSFFIRLFTLLLPSLQVYELIIIWRFNTIVIKWKSGWEWKNKFNVK